MKLSKTSWLLITIGVFVIVLVGLGVIRSQQVNQQNQLNEELNTAELKLNGLQTEPLSQRRAELEQQLSQITSQSETARTALSQPLGSIDVSDFLFDIAEANSVNITVLKSSGLASTELAGITCTVLPLSASVEGNLADLASFITQLNEDLANSVIGSVSINVPEASEEIPSASIQLVIYTYQGG